MSSITPTKYSRIPFDVDGIRITEDNMVDVARWCGGDIVREFVGEDVEKTYIRCRVAKPVTDRQTRGYVGDWVLYTPHGYKVYTNRAFTQCFQPTEAFQKTPIGTFVPDSE